MAKKSDPLTSSEQGIGDRSPEKNGGELEEKVTGAMEATAKTDVTKRT